MTDLDGNPVAKPDAQRMSTQDIIQLAAMHHTKCAPPKIRPCDDGKEQSVILEII